MLNSSAPGKAVLAGEYAVLHPGEPCLVGAVDRQVWVGRHCPTSARLRMFTPDGLWTEGEPAPEWARFAAAVVEEVRSRGIEIPTLDFITGDDMRRGAVKCGLGSSAAAAVAITRALLRSVDGGGTMEGIDNSDPSLIWDIADTAHRSAQGGKGSGADVATSIHGGIGLYVRAPRSWTPVRVHPDVRLFVVFSGESVRTEPRLARWNTWTASHPSERDVFLERSRQAVFRLRAALESGDQASAADAIAANLDALRSLESALQVSLETEGLRLIRETAVSMGAASKFSGSGGGDGAIVLAWGDDQARAVQHMLEARGFPTVARVSTG